MSCAANQGVLVTAVCTLALAWGCTTRVDVAPRPELYISDAPVEASVGLYIEDVQAGQVYSLGGTCMLGVRNSWRIETGKALELASDNTFRKMFTHVTRLRTEHEFTADSLTILISPSIASFHVTPRAFRLCWGFTAGS